MAVSGHAERSEIKMGTCVLVLLGIAFSGINLNGFDEKTSSGWNKLLESALCRGTTCPSSRLRSWAASGSRFRLRSSVHQNFRKFLTNLALLYSGQHFGGSQHLSLFIRFSMDHH